MEGNTIAFLKVASFNYYRWTDFEVFKAFIDSSFSEIRKKAVKNLIIDLRQNRGGSQSSSIHLLQYLVINPSPIFQMCSLKVSWKKLKAKMLYIHLQTGLKGKPIL